MGRKKYNWNKIQKEYDKGKTLRELEPCLRSVENAIKRGDFKSRGKSEAQKLSVNRGRQNYKHTDETKKKLREHMLRRLKEGTYPTLGKNNRNINEPSYPEKFFMKVIGNDFLDKEYEYDKPFGSYALDFAWSHKKRCIEIDGEQHYSQEKQVESDKRKNKYLEEKGWNILRIRWKEMYHNPSYWIEKAKEFIDAPWCNGSTPDSGSGDRGSNP